MYCGISLARPTVISSFSTADEYYPWVFSLWGHANRTEAAGTAKFRVDGTAAQPADTDDILYYKTTLRQLVSVSDFSFQNILACWARLNEGDFCNFYVDVPGEWYGQAIGTWIQASQFGNNVTLFGDNPKGTYYPPDQSPSMSPFVGGMSIRVDFYKKVIDDQIYVLAAGETYTTAPLKRGPFINLDILGQRKR